MKFLMTLLLFVFVSFHAPAQHQYYLSTKGERVEYDTAVVVRISAFKEDLLLMKEKDSLIDSLRIVNKLYEERNLETIMAKERQEEAIDKFLTDLNENPPPPPKHKWYMNPVFGMALGILIGVYLIR